MALPRESSFMPTIKCSLCGSQVEISRMGDHICGSEPAADLTPPPELETDQSFKRQTTKSSRKLYGRAPSPVDTGSSGNAFLQRGQLTPVSQPTSPRNASPIRQGRELSHRQPRQTSDFKNQDPFAAKRPGGYGGFTDSSKDRSDNSPSSETLLNRMNSADSSRRPFAARNAFPKKDSFDKWVSPPDEKIAPPVPKKDGYEGFGPPRSQNLKIPGSLSRSDTVPIMSPTSEKSMVQSPLGSFYPSEAGYGHERQRSMGSSTTRKPPPRTSLLSEQRSRNADSVDLAAEFGVGNPYHAPSDSSSSGYSDFSAGSQSTAATSPDRSQFYKSEREWDSRAGVPRMGGDRDLQSVGASPRSQRGTPSKNGFFSSRDNDYDDPYRNRRDGTTPGRMGPPPPRRQNTWDRQGPTARTPLSSRGDCKACGVAITGKSISSADGRLTGKYHKACFVCTTCSEPFSSSVFYVLDDKPYCGQHYHKLNNSLCGSCVCGIEGQFAEDEKRVKYHIDCFRCLDCDASLADGYFEVDGRAYCEKDAWRRVESQAPAEPDGWPTAPSPYGAASSRTSKGLPVRPVDRPYPPPPQGERRGAGTDKRMRLNKRMTRLGNMKY